MRARLPLPLLFPLLLATGCSIAESLNPSTTNDPLSPAGALVGTWKTAAPVTMKTQTDICGNRATFGTSNWNVTWIITSAGTNKVSVEMHLTSTSIAGVTPIPCSSPGVGYVPMVSPTFITLNVSSSAMSTPTNAAIAFNGSLTSNNIAGTWNHWECLLVCYGEISDNQKFILVKQ